MGQRFHQEHPIDTDALYNLGVVYSELGQLPKAIAILGRLAEIDPNHVHGLIGLGVAYIRMQKLQFGENYLRKAIKPGPKNQWALRNLWASVANDLSTEPRSQRTPSGPLDRTAYATR